MTIITSKANSVVKNAKKLHQKKYRKTSYLIEGWHLFEEAIQAGAKIERIFALAEHEEKLTAYPQTVFVTKEILFDLADSQTPQGIVAIVQKEKEQFPDLSQGKYLFLEDVQDPGNVGTMIRTADAAGFSGVVVSSKSADIFSLKTLRSMQGSHFHLPIYRIPVETFVEEAKKGNLLILATTLSQNSKDYRELARLENFALVMGNEGQGISPFMVDQADQLVHISMKGQAESLNVAIAAGILMFYLS